jgi:membrane-bound lytic murein transglycosylase D
MNLFSKTQFFHRCGALILVALLVSHVVVTPTNAAPRTNSSDAFNTPSGLRGRVDFWKKIFARYGEHEVVIHHRRYPQASFKVLDFRDAAKQYSGVALERFKKKITEDRVDQVNDVLRGCAKGDRPSNDFEEGVYDAMKLIPGNVSLASKCHEAIDEDLVRTQTGIKERYEQAIIRSGRYLAHIENIFVNEFALPVEVTRMPFIESSFDYKANSSVGAAGIWQFMTRTGRLYMTINKAVDERRDPIVASRAAAKYLRQAYGSLGTWPLAVTSYNNGISGVASKVRSAGTNDIVDLLEDPDLQPFGFASGNFFPELLAAIEVYDERTKYFPGIRLESPISFNLVKLTAPASVGAVSSKVKVSIENLRQYNYALTEAVWKGKLSVPKGYNIKVPAARKVQGISTVQEPSTAAAEVTLPTIELRPEAGPDSFEYIVKRGDSLLKIASRFGVTAPQIRSANNMSQNSNIAVGQKLIIPSSRIETRKVVVKSHKVRPGDSLWSISKTYEISLEALKAANRDKIVGGIKAGQVLVIP